MARIPILVLLDHLLMGIDAPKIVEVGGYKEDFTKSYLRTYEKCEVCIVNNFSAPDAALKAWGHDADSLVQLRKKLEKDHKEDKRVRIIDRISVDAAADFKDNSLDWVHLNVDFRAESLTKEIVAWFPKLKIGGIISGGGLSPTPTDLRRTIFEAAGVIEKLFGKFVNFTTEPYYLYWYVRKTKEVEEEFIKNL